MKTTKQTVYLPVKVEGADGNYIPDKSVLIIKEQYEMDKYWKALVKPQEGYFFTPEQLNQLLSDVIKDTLNTAAEKADLTALKKSQYNKKARWKRFSKKDREEGIDLFSYEVQYKPSKKSITNTFEETFNKHSV